MASAIVPPDERNAEDAAGLGVAVPTAPQAAPEAAGGGDVVSGAAADDAAVGFDETTYLRAFPDIAEAVRRGVLASGLAHYRSIGRAELRLDKPEYRALLSACAGPAPPQVAIDTLTISLSGATLITGWSNDQADPLTEISLQTRANIRHHWTAFPRLVRADVARTLDARPGKPMPGEPRPGEPRPGDLRPGDSGGNDAKPGHRFGFMLVAAPIGGTTGAAIDPHDVDAPSFRFASGIDARMRRDPVIATDADLRDLALAALPTAAAGEREPEVIYAILDQHVGVQIAAINRLIADQARTRRMVERFGPSRSRYRGTVITMLRGGADQMVPRLALTGGGPGADDYEFVVVVTRADQFEPALRAARLAAATIGLALTLVLQPDGDPAGTGEDAAADIARSDRLLFMDPCLFPRQPDWALRHTALLDGAPMAQKRLFGGMLYRPDGALSHGGYYFAQETSLLPRPYDVPQRMTAVRLQCVTRPAPLAARMKPIAGPVTGVPAAFMSVDRSWLESLGGFTRNYCRGVHEDIDLCLRSLQRGVPAWVHPLAFWNFENSATVRAEPSKGGAILNDWLLHRQWDRLIVPDLLGQSPALLAGAARAGA